MSKPPNYTGSVLEEEQGEATPPKYDDIVDHSGTPPQGLQPPSYTPSASKEEQRPPEYTYEELMTPLNQAIKDFNEYVSQLQTIHAHLLYKRYEKKDSDYALVLEQSDKLLLRIDVILKTYNQTHHRKADVVTLVADTIEAIKDGDTQTEFKKHRGNPVVREMVGVLKGIVGLFGMVILPLLIQTDATTWKEYKNTFFKESDPVSYRRLNEINEQLVELTGRLDSILDEGPADEDEPQVSPT